MTTKPPEIYIRGRWQAARQTAASTTRKRTKAEALANQIGALDLLSFFKKDREMVREAMTSLQNALNKAFNQTAQ